MIGRTISHFQIVEILGQGGMGVVYKAIDTNLKRNVALKILPPESIIDVTDRKRFIQEAQAASGLSHPNIITVHEIGSADGLDFIVMELVKGLALNQMIGEKGLELSKALKYSIQIADALSKAHEHGIIHRDLKPRNIMVTNEEEVKVLDFGLAKVIAQGPEQASEIDTRSALTKSGEIFGTPQYMSPEQAEGKRIDARSDIFSFGTVLYEMVTGRCAFSGNSTAGVLSSILRDQPDPLGNLRSGIPAELERIVEKSLEKEPEYRYQHMQDVLSDLKKLRRDLSSGKVGPTVRVPARKNRFWPVIASVIVLTALAGGIVWWHPWQSASKTANPSQLRLISNFPGSHSAASFSPDGSMIAFANTAKGIPQIWVKNLAQGDPIQITHDKISAERPAWSPNNDQIVFCRGSFEVSREKESIWTVPPLGGIPRKIIDVGRNPSWSSDGNLLIFERREEIWISKSDGSDQHEVEGVPEAPLLLANRFPVFSPDATQIAFFQSQDGPIGDYWTLPATGGKARRLTFDRARGGSSVWTSDGMALIFPSERSGSMTLWKMNVSGGEPNPVTSGAGIDTNPTISANGNKLIFTNTRNSFNLMLLDPQTLTNQELYASRKEINGPIFSPDGEKIAFFSNDKIMTIDLQNKQVVQINSGTDYGAIFPRWSPDGSNLFFYQTTNPISYRKIRVDGGQSTEVIPQWLWESQYGAILDPTGRSILYTKRSKGTMTATLVRDLQNGKERALPVALDDPRWSRDGKSISGYTSNNEIFICPANGNPCNKLTDGINPVWSADDKRLYYERRGSLDDGAELWSISRDGSGAQKISELRPMQSIGYYMDVSIKELITWVQSKPDNSELWMLDLPSK